MLTENDVIGAACRHLEAAGWRVRSRCHTSERGIDVLAERTDPTPATLRVEAKGATSADARTARYGAPFSDGQVKDHLAKAVRTVLEYASAHPADRAAIALPDDGMQRGHVARIRPALDRLGIGLLWVAADGTVRLDATWNP